MAWTVKPMYVGAHYWFAPLNAAFTSPSAGVVSQNGTWPDVNEANWSAAWALGVCESTEIDPKYGTSEMILSPSPGQVQAIAEVIPYAIPEVKFTTLTVDVLAPELALNTQQLFATATTQFNPNGASGPGLQGILKCQKYSQDNVLILNWQSWAFVKLASALKFAPKALTKPEYVATLLSSPNNTGSI